MIFVIINPQIKNLKGEKMKKLKSSLLVLLLVIALLSIGCLPSTDVLEAEFTITGWEQDVYCGGQIFKVKNGGDYYNWSRPATPATPAIPATPGGPGCPATPATPAIPATPGGSDPGCPICECPECLICECPEYPIPECPSCACCNIKWGDSISIDYKAKNIGNMDVDYDIYFTITFEDGTKCQRSADGYILVGEELFEKAKITIPPKRVVFVEIKGYGLQ